jgi:hypothetical protein
VGQAVVIESDHVHALAVGGQLTLDVQDLPVQRMPRVLHRDLEFVGITSCAPLASGNHISPVASA